MECRAEVEANCVGCGKPIMAGEGRYWWGPNEVKCEECGDKNFNPKFEW